jgi:hypothetical protein
MQPIPPLVRRTGVAVEAVARASQVFDAVYATHYARSAPSSRCCTVRSPSCRSISMTTEDRVAALVRATVDAVPVSTPPPAALRARAARRRRPLAAWQAPLLAAAAVFALCGFLAVFPGPRPGVITEGGAGGPPGSVVLPDKVAGLSFLTAKVPVSPPGPAVAIFHQGSLGTRWGTSQVVVLGADGATYRRLDLAEERGYLAADQEWTPADTLLSPDGGQVAVSDSYRVTGVLDVVDLTSGDARAVEVRPPAAVRPLAWTPDGGRLVIARSADSYDASVDAGNLAVVDLRTGRTAPLSVEPTPGGYPSWTVAVSPDGRSAAVGDGIVGAPLRIVDLMTGSVIRTLTMPGKAALLPGGWSPGGGLIAVREYLVGGQRISFLDVTGGAGGGPGLPAPVELRPEGVQFLGWRSAATVLTAGEVGNGEISEVPLDGSAERVLARFSAGGVLDGATYWQIASALAGGITTLDVDRNDRGPWPTWWRLTLAALVAVAAGLVVRRWLRLRAG